jgi:hypothetical protein
VGVGLPGGRRLVRAPGVRQPRRVGLRLVHGQRHALGHRAWGSVALSFQKKGVPNLLVNLE